MPHLLVQIVLASTTFAIPSRVAPSQLEQSSTAGVLIEELRIGGLRQQSEYSFGSVSAVAPAPDGSFYVADQSGPVVRKYAADGQYLFVVGANGSRAGEYGSVDGVGVTADGDLMVYDSRNARLSWFTSTGEFLRDVPVRQASGLFRSFVYGRDGSAFAQVGPWDGRPQPAWARADGPGVRPQYLEIPPERPVGPHYVIPGHGGYYRPFVTMTLSALGPGGDLYSARNDDYRISHRHPDGSLTEIVRAEEPVTVSPAELRQWEAFSESVAQNARPIPNRPIPERADFFPIPRKKPFIRELVVDLSGRLWVSRYTEAALMEYSDWERDDRQARGLPNYELRDMLSWDVFDTADGFLYSVTFPFKTTFVAAESDVVWGVQGGERNESYIVRWRLIPPNK